MVIKSLKARHNPLSDTQEQLQYLENGIFQSGSLPKFKDKLAQHKIEALRPNALKILQLNLGYMCNQVCAHCHVDAGPDRKEQMSKATLEHCLALLERLPIETLDLTGGAPEMHPHFKWFVTQAHKRGVQDLIVRSNLTILNANKTFSTYPQFFADHHVHVISSLPFYKKEKTDRQRGLGVFQRSIAALQTLNTLGYGSEGSPLKLDLVYNPSGAFLPGDQAALEHDFKKALYEDYGISFNQLFTITNLPISRFLEYLIASENYEDYMTALVEAFNPAAARAVMCTNTLSVRWDGQLYDCDFNQMLDLKLQSPIGHIKDFDAQQLQERQIATSQHCYGCTAGAGSSCQGSVV
jgi:radical SAM/Cys-rich protein